LVDFSEVVLFENRSLLESDYKKIESKDRKIESSTTRIESRDKKFESKDRDKKKRSICLTSFLLCVN